MVSSSPGERFGRRNFSTTEYLSWFALEDTASRAGIMGGLSWSGSWVLHFAKTPEAVLIYGGVDRCAHMLQPGTALESPHVFYCLYAGDVEDGLRGLQSYLNNHLTPVVDKQFPLVTYNTWFAYSWKFTEADLKREVEVARDLGVECFCVNAGRFGGLDSRETAVDEAGIDPGLGYWVSNPEKCPQGIAAFADYVQRNEMKFGLWVEPERAFHDFVGKQIKETWLSKHDGNYLGLGKTHILCLGNPEVREWRAGSTVNSRHET